MVVEVDAGVVTAFRVVACFVKAAQYQMYGVSTGEFPALLEYRPSRLFVVNRLRRRW